MTRKLWRDEETLRYLYLEKSKTMTKIGELLGCDAQTISNWLSRYDIEKPWEDEEWLREKYVDEEKSTTEIANQCGASNTTIYRRVKEYDFPIERASQRPATISNVKGYLQWQCGVNDEYVKVHRLACVAHYGFEAVKDKHVHHENGVRWDNREENLSLKTHGEHMAEHRKYNWLDEIKIREYNYNTDSTYAEIGDQFGVSAQTVCNIVNGTRNCEYAKIES